MTGAGLGERAGGSGVQWEEEEARPRTHPRALPADVRSRLGWEGSGRAVRRVWRETQPCPHRGLRGGL